MTAKNFSARNLRETLIRSGKRVAPAPPLGEIAAYFQKEYARFWDEYKRQDLPHIYKVDLSPALLSLKREMVEALGKGV